MANTEKKGTFDRFSFKPGEITGPYPLLGAMLGVFESFLLYWLFTAQSSLERVSAGILVVVVFISLMFTIIKIQSLQSSKSALPQIGEVPVTPAQEEASKQEVESPTAETMSGPDLSYTIMVPPKGWQWKVTTLDEIIRKQVGEGLINVPNISNVLTINSGKVYSIIPIPGRTKIQDRKVFTALETIVELRLVIIPMTRYTPPFYYESSLENNTLMQVVSYLSLTTISSISQGLMPKSKRKFFSVETSQKMEHVFLTGKEIEKICLNNMFLGIQGDAKDFLLILTYPSETREDITKEVQVLRTLVDSFKPVKLSDLPEVQKKDIEENDKRYAEIWQKKGEEQFAIEFSALLGRFSNMEISKPENIVEAMYLLIPFETLATQTNFADVDFKKKLDSLWKALEKAQKGDINDLRINLENLISEELEYRAKYLIKNQNFLEAIKLRKRVCDLKPDNWLAYYDLGSVCYNFKDYPQAITAYKEAKRIDPNNLVARNNLANSQALAGNYADGLREIEEILKMKPDNLDFQISRYEIYALTNNYDAAKKAIRADIKAKKVSTDSICQYLKECLENDQFQQWEEEILKHMLKDLCPLDKKEVNKKEKIAGDVAT